MEGFLTGRRSADELDGALRRWSLSNRWGPGDASCLTQGCGRRIAAARAEALAAAREKYRHFVANPTLGNICVYRPPLTLTIEEVSNHARKCPGSFTADDLAAAQRMGLEPDLTQSVQSAWQVQAGIEYRAHLEREEAERNPAPRPYVPGAWGDAIRAYGDGAVAQINKEGERWFDARRKSYREEWQRKQRAYWALPQLSCALLPDFRAGNRRSGA